MTTPHSHVTYLVRLSSFVIGATVATHTLLETARDTLFLERVPVANLPWMYVAVAALSLVLAVVPTARGARRALPALLFGAGVGTFVFWLLARSPTHGLFYALYLWTAVCGATAIAQFWTTMARLFTLGEAKRVFATISVGSVVGSIVGAGLARIVFIFTDARTCVLIAALGFVVAGVLSLFVEAPSGDAPEAPRAEMPNVRGVRQNPYLVTIGALALATAVTVTVIDYAFKRAVVHHFDPAQIGPIVASVALASNALGGIVQIFLVPRILSAVGTARSLRLLPGLLVLGAFAGILLPYTLVAVALRVVDGVFRYSLQRTVTELLFVPISEAIRGKMKTLLDVVSQRLGQALASVALLVIPFELHTRALVFAISACAFVWFVLAVRVRPQYLALFRAMIHEGAIEPLEGMPTLDQAGVEALVAALSSERDDQVVLALDVLADRGKAKLIPTLILYHPSPRVVARALELFMIHGRRDAAPLAWKLVTHADPTVATWAVHAVSALDFDVDRLREHLTDKDSQVAATALVELWARGADQQDDLARVDELLSPTGDPLAQRALLRALATTRSRRLLIAALPLAERAPMDVQVEIAHALEIDPIPEGMRVLLPMLAHWPTRDAARRAMVSIGGFALEALVQALGDDDTPYPVRIHVPRSISRFPSDDAVPLLLDLVLHHREGVVRYKALRGLGRLVTDGAVVRLSDALLLQLVERDLALGARVIDWRERLARTPDPVSEKATRARGLLDDLIREKAGNAGERLFRVIALRYRGENWQRIFDGFRSGQSDASRELVEGVLREPLRGQVLSLIDRSRVARATKPASHDEPLAPLLAELTAVSDHALPKIAAHYGRMMNVEPAAARPKMEAPHALLSPA